MHCIKEALTLETAIDDYFTPVQRRVVDGTAIPAMEEEEEEEVISEDITSIIHIKML